MTDKFDLFKRKPSMLELKQTNPVALALFFVVLLIGIEASALTGQFEKNNLPVWLLLSVVIGLFLMFALKIANQWEKAIVLRFGRFQRLAGPGMFWIIPIVDSIPSWIDQRVMVTSFSAEKTLTMDTVPIDVDAVLFWIVWDAQKAALEVQNYREAIAWAAQTALRDIIGKMMLADILVGRDKIDVELQKIIDQRTTPWGVTVQSVDDSDLVIPIYQPRSPESHHSVGTPVPARDCQIIASTPATEVLTIREKWRDNLPKSIRRT